VARKSQSVTDTLQELWELLVSYGKQETISPLKNIGRYLGFGLGGIALLTLAVILLSLSALRALQTQTGDVFDGFWSWVPYLIVVIGQGAVIAVAISRIGRGGIAADPRKAP
jgi:hypothetical protein